MRDHHIVRIGASPASRKTSALQETAREICIIASEAFSHSGLEMYGVPFRGFAEEGTKTVDLRDALWFLRTDDTRVTGGKAEEATPSIPPEGRGP